MLTVLLIGEDETLLQTRAAVVRTVGVETICCNASDALSILSQQSCELAILCHSLSEHTCKGLVHAIREHWPATALLVVSADLSIAHLAEDASSVTMTSAEPESLILHTLELVLCRRPLQPDHSRHPLRRIETGNPC